MNIYSRFLKHLCTKHLNLRIIGAWFCVHVNKIRSNLASFTITCAKDRRNLVLQIVFTCVVATTTKRSKFHSATLFLLRVYWETTTCMIKRYSNSITGLDRSWGFQEFKAPRFQDNQHMKVIRLSALSTGCLYPPGNILGTHFC
jgi:hypothetical protein